MKKGIKMLLAGMLKNQTVWHSDVNTDVYIYTKHFEFLEQNNHVNTAYLDNIIS